MSNIILRVSVALKAVENKISLKGRARFCDESFFGRFQWPIYRSNKILRLMRIILISSGEKPQKWRIALILG